MVLNIESQILTPNHGFSMYMNPNAIKATASHDRPKPIWDILDGAQISKFVFVNDFFLVEGNVPTGNVQGSRMTSSLLPGGPQLKRPRRPRQNARQEFLRHLSIDTVRTS